MSISQVCEYYNCDHRVIKRIMVNNGIQTFSSRDFTRKTFIEHYGGLV